MLAPISMLRGFPRQAKTRLWLSLASDRAAVSFPCPVAVLALRPPGLPEAGKHLAAGSRQPAAADIHCSAVCEHYDSLGGFQIRASTDQKECRSCTDAGFRPKATPAVTVRDPAKHFVRKLSYK